MFVGPTRWGYPTAPSSGAISRPSERLSSTPCASILFAGCFDMETVQHAMKDRRQYKAGRYHNDKPREDCISACEKFSRCRLQFSYWTHTRQNHCGVDIGIDQRHAFKNGIAGYANYQTNNRQRQPKADNYKHSANETSAWNYRLATVFKNTGWYYHACFYCARRRVRSSTNSVAFKRTQCLVLKGLLL